MLCPGELELAVQGLLYGSTNFLGAVFLPRFPGHKSVSFISI
jgi:hypothetical protein